MPSSWNVKILILLASIQGIAALLRGLGWMEIGADLLAQGVLLLPVVGAAAVARGFFIALIAGLYFLFALGAVLRQSWAKWVCSLAAVMNLLLVIGAFSEGAPIKDAIGWSLIPIVLLFELFTQTGREEFRFA
ncbi:MAG TPA: hypothetical protein VIB79_13340 [Candidatus Binatia bacterium]|jgi:hypothetical protein